MRLLAVVGIVSIVLAIAFDSYSSHASRHCSPVDDVDIVGRRYQQQWRSAITTRALVSDVAVRHACVAARNSAATAAPASWQGCGISSTNTGWGMTIGQARGRVDPPGDGSCSSPPAAGVSTMPVQKRW